MSIPVVLHPFQDLIVRGGWWLFCFVFSHFKWWVVVFILFSLIMNNTEHLFMCLFATYLVPLTCLFKNFPISYWFICLLINEFEFSVSFLYTAYKSFTSYTTYKYFSSNMQHVFSFFYHDPSQSKSFHFYEISQFLCVMCHPYGIISNSLPDPMSQMFPHKCFIVLPLYLGLWSISNLFLHKVWGIDPTPFTEKKIFSPFNHLAPLSKFSWPYSSGFISRLTILFQSSMCLSFC